MIIDRLEKCSRFLIIFDYYVINSDYHNIDIDYQIIDWDYHCLLFLDLIDCDYLIIHSDH